MPSLGIKDRIPRFEEINERLHKALESKLFEDQKDSIKLKTLVSSVVDRETQEKIDIIKTDKSFADTMLIDGLADRRMQALVTFMRTNDFEVIVEGVETAEQLAFLRAEGCQVAQGYHFARPLTPLDLEDWLAARALLLISS